MKKRHLAFAEGRVMGVQESGWTCIDCGNAYDATVLDCPNRLLDEAQAQLRAHRVRDARRRDRRAQAAETVPLDLVRGDDSLASFGADPWAGEASGQDASHADGSEPGGQGTLLDDVSAPAVETGETARSSHLPECPCVDGSCCPWLDACDCQCLCDFIAQVEERVLSGFDPSESDADEGYRTGYATAVSDFMSNHGDDATFGLGYDKALLDAQAAIHDLDTHACSVKMEAKAAVRALGLPRVS